MSRNYGLSDELVALVAANPGMTSAQLFDESRLAENRQAVYQAVYVMKTSGRLKKVGKKYFVNEDYEGDKTGSKDLGWELGDDEQEPAKKPSQGRVAIAGGAGVSQSQKPKAAEDPRQEAPPSAQAPVVQDPDQSPAHTPDPMFEEFLDALLASCRADQNPALQELAKRVEKHRPASGQG